MTTRQSAANRAHKSRWIHRQQQVEVEAGGGEHGVAAVAVAALEVVATHAVLGLEVTDHRLDRGAALHLAADGLGDAADLAGDPDPESVGIVVAAIALVDVDALNLDAGSLLQIGGDRAERVAVKGIVQRHGMQHELAAFRRGDRGHDGDLAAELAKRPRLALADAFDFRGVQRIDPLAALAVILLPHPKRQIEQRREAILQRSVALDLAADVADDPPQPGAQEFERATGALELMRVGLARISHANRRIGTPNQRK